MRYLYTKALYKVEKYRNTVPRFHDMAPSLLKFVLLHFISSLSLSIALQGISVDNPVLDTTPVPIPGLSGPSAKGVSCERVALAGLSRLKLGNWHSIHRVTLVPSVVIPEKWHSKIKICFHRNSSLGSCQCEEDDWSSLHKGVFTTIKSPYEDYFIDLKFVDKISGSATITVEVEFQRWRLFCLALGIAMWLVAPIVSSWVPFYYSSSMLIGVILVIIILLFQGMKLLPTGRKNAFYLVLYGTLVSAGSFLLHQLSLLVNSILSSFGLSDEMHSSVTIFLLVFIVLAGAGLGYWIVRKYVVSEDGKVDVGVAQFVKWAIWIVSATCISQSTYDTLLATLLVLCCIPIGILMKSIRWSNFRELQWSVPSIFSWKSARSDMGHQRAEFHRRTRMGTQSQKGTPNSSSKRSDYPVRGSLSPSTYQGTSDQQDFYSTFHNTPERKKFSKKEWDKFTVQSTRKAVSELGASPEFSRWVIKNAQRIKVLPEDSLEDSRGSRIRSSPEDRSNDSLSSDSGSSEETAIESSSGIGLLKRNGRR